MITALMNQKGGVGKTTSVQNLAAAYLHLKSAVLMIDMDPQCNLTYVSGSDMTLPSILDVLNGKAEAASVVQHIEGAPDIITADPMLSTYEGNVTTFRDVLVPLTGLYKMIVVDAPPSLGLLTLSILAACDDVIIPVEANDVCSLQGLYSLGETIDAVRNSINGKLRVAGIFRTKYVARSVLPRALNPMFVEVAESLNTRVFETVIRNCVALCEARAARTDIFRYKKRSNGALDYKALCKEYMEV